MNELLNITKFEAATNMFLFFFPFFIFPPSVLIASL